MNKRWSCDRGLLFNCATPELTPKSRCSLYFKNGAKLYFVQLCNRASVQLIGVIASTKIIFCLSFLQWFGHYFGKKEATTPINTGFFLFIANYVFG